MEENRWTEKRVTLVVLMLVYAVILLYLVWTELQRVRRFQEADAFSRALSAGLNQRAPRRVKRGR